VDRPIDVVDEDRSSDADLVAQERCGRELVRG
jgi:hypothetical protein